MINHRRGKQLKGKRFRCGIFLTLLIGILGVGIGAVFLQGQSYAAAANQIVTRGVIDTLDQLPEGKRNGGVLGTEENPFLILELVPYEEYAEFGYHISGCEPIDVEHMYGRGDLMSLNAMRFGTVKQYTAYFFGDEPEGNPDMYDTAGDGNSELRACGDEMLGQRFLGYYEKVEPGLGSFSFNDEGELVKKADGDIIWHTLNSFEAENDERAKEEAPAAEELQEIGDRYVTYRLCTEEDRAWITNTYYDYQSADNFLVDTLQLRKEEADRYCVVIKTITPEELNRNPEWIDYAQLITITPKSHISGFTDVWKRHNRLGRTSERTEYASNPFVQSDISWEVARKMFDKVSADTDYAGLILDDSIYDQGTGALEGTMKSVTIDILDWNLNQTGQTYSDWGSNNNLYKLAVMLMSMDTELFKRIYLNEENPKIDDTGRYLLQGGDASVFWSFYTFLPSDSTGGASVNNWFAYWNTDEMWETYGIHGAVTESGCKPWVNGHIFTYTGDNFMTFDYQGGALNTDKRFSDFAEYYKGLNQEGTANPSDAVRYILNMQRGAAGDELGTLKVLDIEPCVDAKNGFALTENYIRFMLPKYTGNIEITHQTTAEFIGKIEDLNKTYDMIFLGLDFGAYNTKNMSIQLNDGSWRNAELPDWNDNELDGMIYLHTGDKMLSPEFDNRIVKFLWSTKTNSVVDSTESRFPGNDISKLKAAEIQNFMDAGYPVVAASDLYHQEKKLVDQTSNIYKLIGERKGGGIYHAGDAAEIMNALRNCIKPKVEFTELPALYSGETVSEGDTALKAPNYLNKNGSGQSLLPFRFRIIDESGAKYAYKIYIDQNNDSKFSSDEVIYERTNCSSDGSELSVTNRLSKSLVGLIQWKIEIYRQENEAVRFTEIGCSAAKNSGTKKEIRVLQIMPQDHGYAPGVTDYPGRLDLSNNGLFTKYYNALDDYQITVTRVYLNEVQGWFKENRTACGDKRFSFDNSKEISFEPGSENPKNFSAALQDKFSGYNMIIVGFGDGYGFHDLNGAGGDEGGKEDDGFPDYLKYYIAQGKSILFTHDVTSMQNTHSFGYTANTQLRDVMGMNRYASVSSNLTAEQRESLLRYQEGKPYDTVTNPNYPEDTYGREERHGMTYYMMKRTGWLYGNESVHTEWWGGVFYNQNKDNNFRMPFQYMIQNFNGQPVTNANDFVRNTGFNNNNDETTTVKKLNEGQITTYPFAIDDTLTVAPTHGQWYQLNMEDPEVTVWYCLDMEEGDQYQTAGAEQYDGTGLSSITYGVSPNDAANNYYIYSKKNVFYSGVGHSTVNGDMEAKLFINTMIAAYRTSYEAPVVEINNEEAALVDADTNTYSISCMQEMDAVAATPGGANQVEAEVFGEEESIRIYFTPVELNAVSTEMDCRIYYPYDTDSRYYVTTIYNADTDAAITVGDANYLKGLENGHEYYFDYPKKYLAQWRDSGGTEYPMFRRIEFEIKNNKAVEFNRTTLNMTVQPLFQLD